MSDPVTNVEIEDVLSSIRRLVSEGDKAKRVEKPVEVGRNAAPEKLVLTPALRVPVGSSDSDQDAEKAETQDEPSSEDATVTDEPEQDVVEDTPMAFVEAEIPANDLSDDDTPEENAVVGDAPFDRAKLEEADIPLNRANLEATIAELEAAVTEQSDDWEPDGTDTNLDPTWAAAGFASDQPVEDAIEIADGDTTDSAGDEISATVPPLTFRHTGNDAEEDHGDDLRGGDDTSDDDLAAYLADDTVIDEDMLRQLVLDIVRSELQGKLGERITRNVRKLVRREIHRVLTSQDLD